MGLKSLFIVDKKKDEEEEQKPSNSQPPIPTSYAPSVAQEVVANEDFSVFQDQLLEELESANLPTKQDYMDLKKALSNMSSLAMDESTKFKAAFATLQSIGCDVNQIVESFDYYGNVIDGEKQKFDEAIQSATSDAVLEKQKTVENLTKKNAKNAADIKRLTEDTTTNQQQIANLQAEISTATSKIDQKKANFEAAYNKVKSEMQSDLEKVKLYLSNVPSAPKSKKSTKK